MKQFRKLQQRPQPTIIYTPSDSSHSDSKLYHHIIKDIRKVTEFTHPHHGKGILPKFNNVLLT